MSEDKTYCCRNCEYLMCERNKKHIELPILHSFANFEGTQECYKTMDRVKSMFDEEQGDEEFEQRNLIQNKA
ncbi:hypothetical protein H8S37_04175 [Mediterraneibacter sp. NSJ-55]|uniref:Uncharacterized protein n=1 Tax=Mediterraneibacter hominis TaxID=2763054 RepID=A0A923LGZ9_9FIRM|nr:hypothetical protein [Mediterraneibacter hominis]MBC5688130.1 hypothetical protein [Mediterraneibacter hominis]